MARRASIRAAVAAIGGALLLAGTGCERTYPQDSAQAVITSAREMVESGRADRLTDLIYAETPAQRRLLDRVGRLLGSLQELAGEIREAFPDEVAEMRARAREAAAAGEADDVLSRVFTGRRPGRDMDGDPGDIFNRVLEGLLADPYAFLESESERLTAVPLADDMAALQWDGRPIFGPMVGLTLKETDGRWQVMLPTQFPIVQRWMSDADMRQMLEDMIGALDNTVNDLRDDVRTGEVGSVEEVAHRAGEYSALTVGMVVYAIAKYNEEREDPDDEGGDGTEPG